jgi:hypothetical protein
MEYLGSHLDRKVYWWNFSESNFDELPDKDWVCFVMENGLPEREIFEKFTRVTIQKNIVEINSFGKLSETLHDWFDEVVVEMNVLENKPDVFVMTTWHNNESLANAFWYSVYCSGSDMYGCEDAKIICFHISNIDKKEELKNYLNRFKEGWAPSDND